MTLWFGLALMTVAAIWAVLWPLARRASQWRSGSDVAIYRDQLEEIERDRAAGLQERDQHMHRGGRFPRAAFFVTKNDDMRRKRFSDVSLH